MKGSAYTICFAAVLGTTCALLLTAAAGFTKKYREANQEAEEALNILLALKVPLQENVSSKQVVEARDKNVEEQMRGDLTTYVYKVNDEVLATAMRFAARCRRDHKLLDDLARFQIPILGPPSRPPITAYGIEVAY